MLAKDIKYENAWEVFKTTWELYPPHIMACGKSNLIIWLHTPHTDHWGPKSLIWDRGQNGCQNLVPHRRPVWSNPRML